MTANIAASVHGRLLNVAKVTGEEFERTLVRFASERWLYRLGRSSVRDRFVLKGASLLAVWLPNPHRATRDVDLLGSGRVDDTGIRRALREIASVACAEDGLMYDLDDLMVEPIRAETTYVGARARFMARLGKARIRMQVDIGLGDVVSPGPEEVALPVMLAALPTTTLRAYPREQSIAEKFEAMVQLGVRNGRMKDFHDVWALSGAFAFDGERLYGAVTRCFARRGVPWADEPPPVLTSAFYESGELQMRWRGYREAGGVLHDPPARFPVIGERVVAFLGPVRDSACRGESLRARWIPEGAWTSTMERSSE